MRHRSLAAATLVLLMLTPVAAFAHGGTRTGTTELVVGWETEPAYAGFPNAVEVIVEHDGEPRDDAKLRVTVLYGNANAETASDELVLEKAFGEPGVYHAPMIPTEAGTYTFLITGRVAEDRVDVTMTSGEDTFNPVQEPSAVQFPPSDAGTIGDLSERLDASLAGQATAAQEATDAAESARMVALIALGVAALSAVFAFMATTKAHRK